MPVSKSPRELHPRNVEQTKARLLAGAREEFAEHGLAGARIDRMAERSEANKRLFYAYFGNKQDVFAAVVAWCVADLNDAAPFTVEDLPAYAGRVFDFLAEHDEVRRVLAWRDVEEATPTDLEVGLYRAKLRTVAAEQRSGALDDTFAPADLLALLEAAIGSWLQATVGLRAAGGPRASRRAQHRSAVVEAVRRIAMPAPRPART